MKYDIYNAETNELVARNKTAKHVEKRYLISQEDLEWAIEDAGICEFFDHKNPDINLVVVVSGDTPNGFHQE